MLIFIHFSDIFTLFSRRDDKEHVKTNYIHVGGVKKINLLLTYATISYCWGNNTVLFTNYKKNLYINMKLACHVKHLTGIHNYLKFLPEAHNECCTAKIRVLARNFPYLTKCTYNNIYISQLVLWKTKFCGYIVQKKTPTRANNTNNSLITHFLRLKWANLSKRSCTQ